MEVKSYKRIVYVYLLAPLVILLLLALNTDSILEIFHQWQENAVLREDLRGSLKRYYIHSNSLHRDNKVFVYLPAGYSTCQSRYPVIYLLHGQPGNSRDFLVKGHIQNTVERFILAKKLPPMILVSADSFGPGGAKDRSEYLNAANGSFNAEEYFAHELPDYIDRNYRTINKPLARVLMGVSSGGYGAVNIGMKHQDRFRILASISGYFRPDDDYPYFVADLGARKHLLDINNPFLHIKKWKTNKRLHLYISVGAGDDLCPENRQFAHVLSAKRVDARFHTVSGGHHWNTFRAEFNGALRFIGDRLKAVSSLNAS